MKRSFQGGRKTGGALDEWTAAAQMIRWEARKADKKTWRRNEDMQDLKSGTLGQTIACSDLYARLDNTEDRRVYPGWTSERWTRHAVSEGAQGQRWRTLTLTQHLQQHPGPGVAHNETNTRC